jgi:uncharacterized protein YcnI
MTRYCHRHVVLRLIGILLAMGVAAVMVSSAASAHVTVSAPGVAAGTSDAAITFRVPTE